MRNEGQDCDYVKQKIKHYTFCIDGWVMNEERRQDCDYGKQKIKHYTESNRWVIFWGTKDKIVTLLTQIEDKTLYRK